MGRGAGGVPQGVGLLLPYAGWAAPSPPARLRWTQTTPPRLLPRRDVWFRFPLATRCSLAGVHQAGPPLFPIWCRSRCGVEVFWQRSVQCSIYADFQKLLPREISMKHYA